MARIPLAAAVLVSVLSTTLGAQWLNYPTPGTPRLPDGKPDLLAAAPRTLDGKPDLSGVWRGAGPLYRFNIAQDLEPTDIQPWAEALFVQRVRDARKDSPLRYSWYRKRNSCPRRRQPASSSSRTRRAA